MVAALGNAVVPACAEVPGRVIRELITAALILISLFSFGCGVDDLIQPDAKPSCDGILEYSFAIVALDSLSRLHIYEHDISQAIFCEIVDSMLTSLDLTYMDRIAITYQNACGFNATYDIFNTDIADGFINLNLLPCRIK